MKVAVTILLILALIYIILGVLFGITLLVRGIAKFDKNTGGTGITFKFLIFPGIVLFWPILLTQWLKKNKES